MNDIVRKDLIKILSSVITILKEKEVHDIIEMKDLSNGVIDNVTIFGDEDAIALGVFIYALSKIIERKLGLIKYAPLIYSLRKAKDQLEHYQDKQYKQTMQGLFSMINRQDQKLKLYIEEVLQQAHVRKGSKLFEHGLSVGRAAHTMGVSQWELMSYIGSTKLTEEFKEGVSVKNRIALTKRLFP